MSDPDLSVIVTGHREGVIAGATVRSAEAAIAHAVDALGIAVEVIVVLDRADAVTRAVLEPAFGAAARVLRTDEGDPGQARNAGIAAARGTLAAFLDADDLWSENWLTEACRLVERRPDCVAHSACNLVFGHESALWWHIDSEGPLFDPGYLDWANYWDALSLARTAIYRAHPFRRNDLKLGFGHEDWHWNAVTIAAGIAHKPAPQTMHFKRRRQGSQMSLVAQSGAVSWPLDLPEDHPALLARAAAPGPLPG